MKQYAAILKILILALLFLPAACSQTPAAIATLAPTAGLPFDLPVVGTTPAIEPTGPAIATPTPILEAATSSPETPTLEPPTATPTETPTPTPAPPPVDTYQIIATYPHDPDAFTQGLDYDGGRLFEGTGRWGQSSLREVVLESGTVLRIRPLEDQYFGEGITVVGNRIYQLTWQEGTGFIYDRNTFDLLETFYYPHEGWGITHDGQQLIVSDGTPIIRFWDPVTMEETRQITVRELQGPLNRLNELEYIDGQIWANIWMTDMIVRIDPETGDVLGYIDLTGLLDTSTLTRPVDVLNGIAHDPETNRLFITGKLWPTLFEIEIIPGN